MKIAFYSAAAVLALAAASLTGCKTSESCGTCSDSGACTDKTACCESGKAASCDSAAATKGTATAAVNTACPFSGGPVNSALTASYNGKTVGFCCAGCQSKWEAASDADRAAMFTKVSAAK
jgi:hypothetical protein